MFSPCVFVCLFVSLSRCLSGRFNYERLVPHKQYFAGTLLGMSSCASYVSHTHDVIDDVTWSQSRSNFEIDISPSIFVLEHRSKAQNVDKKVKKKKVCLELKLTAILESLKYQTQLQFDHRYEKIVQNYAKKSIFMMMTSSMTSQGGLKVDPLYSFINEITTFFMITKQRAKIPLPFAYISRDYDCNYINIYSWRHWWRHQVTKKSNFEIAISPSIFHLQCRSNAQNVGNTHGYLSGIFNFRYNFR